MSIFRFTDAADAADTACRAIFSGSDVAGPTRIDLVSSLALPAQSLELGVLKSDTRLALAVVKLGNC
jgi:hypothetical protein